MSNNDPHRIQSIKDLVHSLRGDLSVVSTELAFLSGQFQDDQLGLARKRCASMAQALTSLVRIVDETAAREQQGCTDEDEGYFSAGVVDEG